MPVSRTIRLRRESWGFAVGSLLFVAGAVLSASDLIDVVVTDLIFFTGALFFTAAAFIQLAMSRRPRRDVTRADALDWWAAVVQFGGTLFFNLSTTQALLNALHPTSHLRTGWRPDVFGSACFLVAGVLAIFATTMRDTLWDPNARIWRCTWLNMVGSIFFAISAIGAYVAPSTGEVVSELWANLGTLLGAACFLVAALLSRDADAPPPSATRHR
ncbi:hypothetical protein ABIE21_001452 [Conyzicola nivalis]|uniref:YrhK domain-containing protein n=1 Tax=Conyzicola nivalis TaxID=1477021 RepID=A0ABV2QLV2_9MICO